MEPIEVTACFRPDGDINIQSLQINSVHYPVISTGRSWSDAKGFHILAMIAGNQVLELLFKCHEMRWFTSSNPAFTASKV